MMKGLLVAGFSAALIIAGCSDNSQQSKGGAAMSRENETTTSDPPPDGKAILRGNCATCHNTLNMLHDATGPALGGSLNRWGGDAAALKSFIRNPQAAIFDKKIPRAVEVYQKYKPAVMTPFPDFTEEELDALIAEMK